MINVLPEVFGGMAIFTLGVFVGVIMTLSSK